MIKRLSGFVFRSRIGVRDVLEWAGYGCLVGAVWQVDATVGLAAGGVALLIQARPWR